MTAMNIDRILRRLPVNKLAAKVTGQKNVKASFRNTAQEERAALKKLIGSGILERDESEIARLQVNKINQFLNDGVGDLVSLTDQIRAQRQLMQDEVNQLHFERHTMRIAVQTLQTERARLLNSEKALIARIHEEQSYADRKILKQMVKDLHPASVARRVQINAEIKSLGAGKAKTVSLAKEKILSCKIRRLDYIYYHRAGLNIKV